MVQASDGGGGGILQRASSCRGRGLDREPQEDEGECGGVFIQVVKPKVSSTKEAPFPKNFFDELRFEFFKTNLGHFLQHFYIFIRNAVCFTN